MIMKQLKLNGNENILVVRPDRIGDLVLALPIASVIKSIYPDIKIDYLVSDYNYPLIKYAAYIDGSLIIDNGQRNPKAAGELIADLESKKYDIVIFAKPDLITAFCAYLARIPVRLGTSRRGYSFLFNIRAGVSRRYSMIHELDLNLSLLKPGGYCV